MSEVLIIDSVEWEQLMYLSFEYAEKNFITHRSNNINKGCSAALGSTLLQKEHLTLQNLVCSLYGIIRFSIPKFQQFFNHLKFVSEENRFPAHCIFNMDKTEVSYAPNKILKVISSKGMCIVFKVVSVERGQTVIVICRKCPFFLPPAVIFRRKRMKPEIFKDVHEGTIPMISDNGFINMELFISWLKHLNNFVKSTQDESVLLRLDSHFSHIRHEAVTLCREQDITLLSITSH